MPKQHYSVTGVLHGKFSCIFGAGWRTTGVFRPRGLATQLWGSKHVSLGSEAACCCARLCLPRECSGAFNRSPTCHQSNSLAFRKSRDVALGRKGRCDGSATATRHRAAISKAKGGLACVRTVGPGADFVSILCSVDRTPLPGSQRN